VEIDIEDFAFNPKAVTIQAGTTIKWGNKDTVTHTVVSDDGSWSSNSLAKGDTFSYTFTQAGTFSYSCGVHPSMKGTITVVAP
jgi:plastocyanin